MAVTIQSQLPITAGDTDWAAEAEANRVKANGNDTALKAAVDALQTAVPVQKIKSGATTYTPDGDGLVTLPGGVVAPATTTTQRDAIATPTIGQLIFNTTNGRVENYTATGWQPGIPALTTAQRTALPAVVGLLVYDTTDGGLYSYAAGGWARIGSCRVDVFTASGTWAKPLGAKLIDVVCIGGGGGGRSETTSSTRPGGSGGGYDRKLLIASQLPSSVSVTVGAGGVSGGTNAGTNGGAGGASAFDTYAGAEGGVSATTTINPGGAALGSAPITPVVNGTTLNDTDASRGGTAFNSGLPNLMGAPYGGGAGGYGGTNQQAGGASGQAAGGAVGGGSGTSRSGTGLAGSGGGGANASSGGSGGVPGGGGGCGIAANGGGGTGGRGEVIVITIF